MPAFPDSASAAPPLTLGRVVVLVRDCEAALAFYRAAFGARVLYDGPGPSGERYLHVGFGAETGAGIWLLRAGGGSSARVGQQTGGEPLIVFYTPDLAVAVARAVAAGAEIVRAVEHADGAGFAHLADLYGNVILLVELPPATRHS